MFSNMIILLPPHSKENIAMVYNIWDTMIYWYSEFENTEETIGIRYVAQDLLKETNTSMIYWYVIAILNFISMQDMKSMKVHLSLKCSSDTFPEFLVLAFL